MKLKVLVDNNTYIDQYYLGEPAVSYYIEDEDTKILFDTGYSDIFISNSKKMGIDLNNIDKIVISHGHDDHTKGLKYFFENKKDVELIAHPNCFCYKEDNTGLYIGSPLKKEELEKKCHLNLVDKPIKISKNIYYLGEIPEVYNFERRYSIGKTIVNNNKGDDYVIDDAAIAQKSDDGIVVITGCSHSGICNIIEYSKKVCKDDRVIGVIGGFHLFNKDERLSSTIEYFKNNNIKLLYPCHCVSLQAKIEIGKEIKIGEVGVGLEINF